MAGKRSNTTKARASSEETPASSKKLKKTLEGEAVDKKEEEKEIQQSSIGVIDDELEARFLGDVVPTEEARQRWPKRYEESIQGAKPKTSKDKAESDEVIQARCHYMQAEVDGRTIYDLYDDAHVKAGEEEDSYICKIVEMFEGVDGALYFTAQWYYRAKDTVIKDKAISIDPKRVFFSEVQDDNPLDCLLAKLNIVRLPLNVDLDAKKKSIPNCDYYCDTKYLLPYSTFENLPAENNQAGSETTSTISVDVDINGACEVSSEIEEACQGREHNKEVRLLDLYSGCGAMSTGLCLGAQLSGLNLVTRWAVDLNQHACDSLKVNHPETKVRNESADDFLSLLKEWEKLCVYFNLVQSKSIKQHELEYFNGDDDEEEEEEEEGDDNDEEAGEDSENFEVEKILDVCYGDPKDTDKRGLYFKVRWRGYGADEDTWEPMDGLSHCKESIKQFVIDGFQSKILPLSGDVHVICGGPPCQGISGFNRFRNKENPLKDEKNKQLIVFMDIVQYLKPKFVLMENVVDLVKFADGFLGRYALGRLIEMNYQARMGMMAAGAYGLPQFRMRVFLWGACPTEKLPQYPLPTHDVVVRGVIPLEFESNTVAYNEGHHEELEKRLLLEDAISDLPAVGNYDNRDEMPYEKPPQTEFQKFIRLSKYEMLGYSKPSVEPMLYDHRSLELNPDDYARVCRVPKNKGANFRDFPGVRVRSDNKVEWDPNVKRVYLDSGKPLVPDYAMSFVNGSSSKPFGRLWWDETVPTVVTRAEPHNQVILHPEQDRVLSVRENARLQGFPDYYKLSGPVKERYIQVGNAVAVPVARAIGYALGIAYQGSINEGPLFKLPSKFLNLKEKLPSASSEDA